MAAIICPNCGQENPDGFHSCGNCGVPLADATPVREERKRAGGAGLNEALAFYRSVRATRYVREAEALLAASA